MKVVLLIAMLVYPYGRGSWHGMMAVHGLIRVAFGHAAIFTCEGN
jgi:hypothetical protein